MSTSSRLPTGEGWRLWRHDGCSGRLIEYKIHYPVADGPNGEEMRRRGAANSRRPRATAAFARYSKSLRGETALTAPSCRPCWLGTKSFLRLECRMLTRTAATRRGNQTCRSKAWGGIVAWRISFFRLTDEERQSKWPSLILTGFRCIAESNLKRHVVRYKRSLARLEVEQILPS